MPTYEEYLKQNISLLERLGDKFSGADERLDYVVRQLQIMQKEMGLVMPLKTQQIVFSRTLPLNTGIRLEEFLVLDGAITSVAMHFPRNCNNLVDIAFGHGHKQLCPSGGFIALNDACPVFPTSEACKQQEDVWCIMDNHDGFAAHTVACIVTIEGS
ncbi:unnamed protein product [marine sediment metagenome]|uniref:Uncharacterized protein n=1 Tax=marine sediment metagenome TaxID=412755 RepID=X1J7N0_9ZZZZ